MRPGFNIVTTYELAKVMGCIVFPVFLLLLWKYREQFLADTWERQFGGLQHRQFREDQIQEQETDYESIISNFEERRAKALEKKRKELMK
ncbi:hypothetical protein AGDE_02562 [Angomonas deanei]|nr:hypothetical protein AGDE_02562 [Angomonas deanei]|eukprot:EPY41362.1 hypothetical protein AGDE_02562 [Angomonas deanei]